LRFCAPGRGRHAIGEKGRWRFPALPSGKLAAIPTLLLPFFLPLLCLASPGDRQAAQTPKISVEVKAVTVYATVRDKHGHIITNLTKDDFALEQDAIRKPSNISPTKAIIR
jgi:hypothetical protein